jgi:hypothetical protein
MKKFWLVTSLLCCVAASLFGAAPQFFVSGSTSFERNRVTRLEQSLNFTREPMVSTWTAIIDPGEVFTENTKKLNLDTESGYTYVGGLNQTHLNEDYLVWHGDQDVRHLLAHEAGHLICGCKSEQRANDIAYVLETQ